MLPCLDVLWWAEVYVLWFMLPFFSFLLPPLSSPLPSSLSFALVYKFWHDNFFCYKCMTPERRSTHHLFFFIVNHEQFYVIL